MIEHPGIELQVLIKEKGLTQKAFSSILGKKVSEVNELLKGKRNITIQRDYLLHQTLGTPIKYRILKQIDYEYSLLDIDETNKIPLDKGGDGKAEGDLSFGTEGEKSTAHQTRHSEALAEESTADQTRHSERSEESSINNLTSLDSSTSLRSSLNDNNDVNLSNNEESASDGDQNNFKQQENSKTNNSPSEIQNIQNDDKVDNENGQKNNDKDFKERAQIFKSF